VLRDFIDDLNVFIYWLLGAMNKEQAEKCNQQLSHIRK